MQLKQVTIQVGPTVRNVLLRFQMGKLPAGFQEYIVPRPPRNGNLPEGRELAAAQEPWQHLVPALWDDFAAARFGLTAVRVYRDEPEGGLRKSPRHIIMFLFSRDAKDMDDMPDVKRAFEQLAGEGWRLVVNENPWVEDGNVVAGVSKMSINLRDKRQIAKDEPRVPLRLQLSAKETAIVES